MAGFRRVRGIRSKLPSGVVIGRTTPGSGKAEMIDLPGFGASLAAGAPAASGTSAGVPIGGSDGQVLAKVSGSVAWSFLSLLTKVGTLTVGVWNATKINLGYGGTNADLSATGGSGQVLKQDSSGGNVTVGLITILGTIATGVWQGTKVALGYGGTNADLSATGPGFLKQATLGANVTVAALADSDLPTQGGLTPGAYTLTSLTVNAQGFITAASSGSGGTGTVTHTAGALTLHAPIVGAGTDDEKALAAMTNGQLMIGNTGNDPSISTLTAGANITITNSAGGITIASSAPGTGTVTSVSLTVPAELSVSGSPVTTSGTLAVTWANENDNTILSRIAGSAGVPSFNTVNAILDHALGSTNDKFAIRRSGSWTQDQISALLTAGTGISFSGTTNLTISGAYTAGTGISIAGAVISATGGTTNATGNVPLNTAPMNQGQLKSTFGEDSQVSTEGIVGGGFVGSGPVGGATIQFNLPKQRGHTAWWDGIRWVHGNVIIANYNNYPGSYGDAASGGLFEANPGAYEYVNLGSPTRLILTTFDNSGVNSAFSTLNTRLARGTPAAPTAVQSGDILATMFAPGGYGTSQWSSSAARIRAITTEAFTNTANGCYINIATANTGSTTLTEVARFQSTGCWLLGTNTNDNAAAGVVGEYVSAEGAGSDVNLTTGTIVDLKSINLTAGDWDVWAEGIFVPASTTTVTQLKFWINTTSVTDPSAPNGGAEYSRTFSGAGSEVGVTQAVPGLRKRVSLATTTTVYISGKAAFGTSTATMGGAIYARRVR